MSNVLEKLKTDILKGEKTNAKLFNRLMLARVSRTFALTIRSLGQPFREPVLVGYLLCRIADTYEDSTKLSVDEKTAALEKNGIKLIQRGEYTGGRYAYFDANDSLKMVLELLEND